MQEVSAVCNQIIIINEGKMIVTDTPDRIASHIEQTNEIKLLVRGNKELVKSILERMEGIKECSVDKTEAEDECEVLVVCDAERDIREDLFFSFAESKCPILEMSSREPSLEEVFIKLTGNGSRQRAAMKRKKQKEERKNDSDL